jgi:hypothetical protein
MKGRKEILFISSDKRIKTGTKLGVIVVRELGNFRYILIPEIINKFMTNISDPVRAKHLHVFKLNFK